MNGFVKLFTLAKLLTNLTAKSLASAWENFCFSPPIFSDLVRPLSVYTASQLSFYNSIIIIFNENLPVNAGSQAMRLQIQQKAV